jgi:hypothetical protein
MTGYRSAIVTIGFLVAGCAALGPNGALLDQQAQQIRDQCQAQFAGGTIKTNLDAERCANPSVRALYAQAGVRDMDVFDAYFAKREASAAQLDRKVISPEDEKAQIATAKMDANSEIERRTNGRIAASAAISSMMPLTCTHIGFSATCY